MPIPAASTPTEIRLHALVVEQRVVMEEQQRTIQNLQEQLRLALRRQFGPRNEFVDIDQFSLLAGLDDGTVIIESHAAAAEESHDATTNASTTSATTEPAVRRQAVRILKDLPREVRIVDLTDADKVCACCGGALHHFGDESSEQLQYVPARLMIIETRRRKYVCTACPDKVQRAKADGLPPIPKSMASASLLAFLIVSKFADHMPLYRIALRLQRLGIELSHSLMSEWLLGCAELLEGVHARILDKVLASGHVFTDDTILPMQNDEPGRRTTIKARLWVYACHQRRQKPLVAYDFSRTRSQAAPLRVLDGYQGFIQADAFPGYDKLYLPGLPGHVPHVTEIACWAHARRKFVDVTALMKTPGRAHEAIAYIKRLYRIERQAKALSDMERLALRQEKAVPVLAEFKAWLDQQAHVLLPKSAMGNAVLYALKNWEALCRYTEQGFLEIDNNYAERCMKPVALGRKNYMFVGNERGGRAAAIYYSLMESCKSNKVNPLTYMTYLLSNVRNKGVTLLLPDEFQANNLTQIG